MRLGEYLGRKWRYLHGQISVGFGLVDAVLDVEPTGGRRKPASRYTTGRVDVKGIIAEISNPFPRKKRGRDFVD
jgi:hypothetical protein